MNNIKIIGSIILCAMGLHSIPCIAQDTVYYGHDPKYIFYDLPDSGECDMSHLDDGSIGFHSGRVLGGVNFFPMQYVSSVDSIYGFAIAGSPVFCEYGHQDTSYHRVCIFEYTDHNHVREVASVPAEDHYRAYDEFMAYWNPDGSLWDFHYQSSSDFDYHYGIPVWIRYLSRPYHPTGPFFVGYPQTEGVWSLQSYIFIKITDTAIIYPCRVRGAYFMLMDQDSIALVGGPDYGQFSCSYESDGEYYTSAGQFFYPIILPPTVSDSVPVCAGVDGFRLGVVMDDVVIFYWNQGSDGHYQCSLGPVDSEPEDNALVDFVDGQNFLRYTDLPDGEYKAWVRRECFHDCYFHRDSTYYSDWSEPVTFRVGDPPDDTVAVDNVLATNDITLVPNPATLQVTVTSSVRMATVTLTDLGGREVLCREVNAEQAVLDISTLPKGVYLATIVTSQATTTKRLIVN